MIFFNGKGRLGNQIFQYCFLKSRFPNRRIFSNTFFELFETFESDDSVIVVRGEVLWRIIRRVCIILAKFRLIGEVFQGQVRIKGVYETGTEVFVKAGLLPIVFVSQGYFQSEQYFNPEVVKNLRIRSVHLSRAERWLAQERKGASSVFVHVRRSDYANVSHLGRGDIRLPIDYYQRAFEVIKESASDYEFVFVTDDVAFVEREFSNLTNKRISEERSPVDFALMSLCDGGVMANSSFSWWGGYFCKRRLPVIAPRDWVGFASKTEHPSGIIPNFAKAVDVL